MIRSICSWNNIFRGDKPMPRMVQCFGSVAMLVAFVWFHPIQVDAAQGNSGVAVQESVDEFEMTSDQIDKFGELALKGIVREYPNKPSNVMATEADVRGPKEMHPAFYGSFDWHSSVHGHWLLVRILHLYPDHPMQKQIRESLANNLSQANLQAEADYFAATHNKGFERMYGWAWLLRLVQELEAWDDDQGNQWREDLRPLEAIIVERTKDYLPKLTWPIRTGVHPDSAFALGQVLDYARATKQTELEDLVVETAKRFYLEDVDYPGKYEPSGEDFFSAGLNEADLMRRVLPADKFQTWLNNFFPGLKDGKLGNLLEPATVSDVTDGKIVHLAGLNLSRAWTLSGIASVLPADSEVRKILSDSANAHAKAGVEYVFSGHYEGEHWLATFAVYHLTGVGIE